MSNTDAFPPDTLRLNPNCCYNACPGCRSTLRLREFQDRHPADWHRRVTGSQRLLRIVVGGGDGGSTPAERPKPVCCDCSGPEAIEWSGVAICVDCYSRRASVTCATDG